MLTKSERIHEVRNQGGKAICVVRVVVVRVTVVVHIAEVRSVTAIRRHRI